LLNPTDYRDNAQIFLSNRDFQCVDFCPKNIRHSNSQLLQALFVLFHSREKPGDIFVDPRPPQP
jgi:hypothetical protein